MCGLLCINVQVSIGITPVFTQTRVYNRAMFVFLSTKCFKYSKRLKYSTRLHMNHSQCVCCSTTRFISESVMQFQCYDNNVNITTMKWYILFNEVLKLYEWLDFLCTSSLCISRPWKHFFYLILYKFPFLLLLWAAACHQKTTGTIEILFDLVLQH